MHVDAEPLALLVALTFLVPWAAAWSAARRAVYRLLAARLRRRLGFLHRVEVLVFTGTLDRQETFDLVQQIRAVPPGQPLVLLIDSNGGDVSAGLQVGHALAGHPGKVTLRVIDECWSAATVIACAADEIIMAPDANLGPTDAIGHVGSDELRTAMVVGADSAGRALDVHRSHAILRYIVQDIAAFRLARGTPSAAAFALAQRLTMGEDDHWRPLFPEQAAALGLPVRVAQPGLWARLMLYHGRSR